MLEEALKRAVDPLRESRLIAREALNIPELPRYIGQNLMNLIGKIDDGLGRSRFSPEGWIERYINIKQSAKKCNEATIYFIVITAQTAGCMCFPRNIN